MTSSCRVASKIGTDGFRKGADGAVYFGEEMATSSHFALEAAARTGARSSTVIEFTIPKSLAGELGLLERSTLGGFRGAPPIDIPFASGYERLLTGRNINLFNEAMEAGQITTRRLRLGAGGGF